MPKPRNAHLIQLELYGKTVKLSQPEHDLSPDEWYRRRTEAFAQLRSSGGIPEELILLVENFKEQHLVELFVYRPSKEVVLRFGVKVLPDKKKTSKRLSEILAVGKRINDKPNKKGMRASEALAFVLRMTLRELKHKEQERRAAPVRTLKSMPRSLIAEIAMDLLGSCETWGYPPGYFLNSLLRELLNLDRDHQRMSRDIEKQERAAAIVAQAPSVGTRQLAKALNVNASTISRWRKSPGFKKLLEQKIETIKNVGQAGDKFSEFANKGLIQQETVALLLATVAQLYRPCDKSD